MLQLVGLVLNLALTAGLLHQGRLLPVGTLGLLLNRWLLDGTLGGKRVGGLA